MSEQNDNPRKLEEDVLSWRTRYNEQIGHTERQLGELRDEIKVLKAENVDKGTQLEIALDALELSVGMNTMNEMARLNAIETLRGK